MIYANIEAWYGKNDDASNVILTLEIVEVEEVRGKEVVNVVINARCFRLDC